MNKLHKAVGAGILAMGILLPGLAAANPCESIAKACMQQGYYKGGSNVGRGLIENCVLPVASNRMALPGLSVSQSQLAQCKALVMEKMQSN